MSKPITEKTSLVSHRNFSNEELLKHTFGKNGITPLHAVGTTPPTRTSRVIADAIMSRAPSNDKYGLEQVLRRGINSDTDALAIQHEIDQQNLRDDNEQE